MRALRLVRLTLLALGLLVAAFALGVACDDDDDGGSPTPTASPTETATGSPTASPTSTAEPTSTSSPTPQPTASPAEPSLEVPTDTPFTLSPGEEATVQSAFNVRFVGVTSDSRCPANVNCIQAGEAVVELLIGMVDDVMPVSLAIPPGGSDEVVVGNWVVVALSLEPQPVSTGQIDPADYELQLTVIPGDTPAGPRSVEVFFSRHPESDNDPATVFPVPRESPDAGVARFAVQELLAGPTASEQSEGYFSIWTDLGYGAGSDCGTERFTIAIEDGVATVRFCVTVSLLGTIADGQADQTLQATLEQFGNIDRAVILNKDGHCMFDESGMDLCLEDR